MPILFDFYQTPLPKNAEKKHNLRYHARVVGGCTLGIDMLSKHISQRCTLSKADVTAVLIELIRELVNVLCDGYRLAIPGLGYFSLTITALKDRSPTCTHNQNLSIKHVEFRADQSLKDELDRAGIKSHL